MMVAVSIVMMVSEESGIEMHLRSQTGANFLAVTVLTVDAIWPRPAGAWQFRKSGSFYVLSAGLY